MIRGLLVLFGSVLVAGAAMEQPSKPIILTPEAAAQEGRKLVQEILSQRPDRGFTNTGVLKVIYPRTKGEKKDRRTETPIRFGVIASNDAWLNFYEAPGTNVTIHHSAAGTREYHVQTGSGGTVTLTGNETMIPFAASDFWIADLGLEFLHWPEQRLLRKELRRGQACNVLESLNPHPAPGAYSRVVTWIDADTDGPINAEAYDSNNKILKEFIAKSFKKVRGEWELQEIEMDNRQTGTRTWIDFDVGTK